MLLVLLYVNHYSLLVELPSIPKPGDVIDITHTMIKKSISSTRSFGKMKAVIKAKMDDEAWPDEDETYPTFDTTLQF